MIESRALWLARPGQYEIRGSALLPPAADEVLVQTRFSAISRGTEALVFAGRVPASQYSAMRCPFQEGDFPAPIKYGYAAVGTVLAGAPALRGRRVFCLHPHQDRFIVPAAAAVLLPAAVSDRRAALAANMETALNGLWDAAPRLGDRIAVVGIGTVGALLAALAARLPGTAVTMVDSNPARAALAEAFGCGFALPGAAAGDCDIVVHASGTAAGLSTALALAGFEATVLEMSWYGDRPIVVSLGEAFHSRRLVLRSSQVGAVAPARRQRWSRERRLALALDLLADPVFDRLITGESSFDDAPEVLARLSAAPAGALAHLLCYSDQRGDDVQPRR